MLEPATLNTISNHTQSLLPLIKINTNEEFEIPEILDSKIDHWKKYKLQYLVRWLEYKDTDKKTS